MFKLFARFLFCGAAMAASYASVSFASPWANATSKPTGAVNGGTVVLIPFAQGGAVTDAKVDDGNGAAASLNFRNMDSADALDQGRLEGAVFDIPAGSGLSVEWRARLSAGVEAYVEIVNGPSVIDPATSYSVTSEASASAECWNSAGTTTPIVSAIACSPSSATATTSAATKSLGYGIARAEVYRVVRYYAGFVRDADWTSLGFAHLPRNRDGSVVTSIPRNFNERHQRGYIIDGQV